MTSLPALFALLAATASAEPLTLDSAIADALAQNPEAKIAASQSAAARAQTFEARAGLLPQVGLSASYQFGASFPHGVDASTGSNFGASVSVDQLVWDFGRVKNRWRAAQATAASTEQSEAATRNTLVLNVRLAFLDLLETRALIAVGEKTLENHERHLAQTKELVDIGTRPTIDLAKLRTEVASAKASLVRARGNERVARAQMSLLMGRPLGADVEIVEASFPALALEAETAERLLALARENRPELAAQRSAIQASELNLKIVQRDLWPTLRAGAGAGWTGVHIGEPNFNAQVGLSLSWTIFDGLAKKGAVGSAEAGLTVEQLRLSLQEQQILTAIEEARINVRAAQSELLAAEDALAAAKELLLYAEERYQAGVGNVIELTDAEFDVSSAESLRVSSLYSLAEARARLLQAVGQTNWPAETSGSLAP